MIFFEGHLKGGLWEGRSLFQATRNHKKAKVEENLLVRMEESEPLIVSAAAAQDSRYYNVTFSRKETNIINSIFSLSTTYIWG